MSPLIKETKTILEQLPTERLKVAQVFLRWLSEEDELSADELKTVLKGEREIALGKCADRRSVARTI